MKQQKIAEQLIIAKGAISQAEGALQEETTPGEAREKATFYLAPGQLEKLDDLAHGYRKRTGRRVNRNEIIRFLIDRAELEILLAEW